MPIAYHFLKAAMTSGRGNEQPWSVGETRSTHKRLELCNWGYHSSPTIHHALQYAPGPVLCLVEVPATRLGHLKDDTKQVGSWRRLVKAVNVERELHLIACDIAEDVLPLWTAQYPDDPRPAQTIATKRRWLNGQATDAELSAAWSAAWSAALSAAESAARNAALSVAESAARNAALSAARSAARNAAESKYNGWIDTRLGALLEEWPC